MHVQRFAPLSIALLALASVSVVAADWAAVRVDALGEPAIAELSVSSGFCARARPFVAPNGVRGLTFECGAPPGLLRFSAKCGDPGLPTAVVEAEFSPGGSPSNYVQFNDVCSSSAAQIDLANRRRLGSRAWRAN